MSQLVKYIIVGAVTAVVVFVCTLLGLSWYDKKRKAQEQTQAAAAPAAQQ